MPKQEFMGIPQEMAKKIYENVKKNEEATCLQCKTLIGYYSLVGITVRLDNDLVFCCGACAEEWIDKQDEDRT